MALKCQIISSLLQEIIGTTTISSIIICCHLAVFRDHIILIYNSYYIFAKCCRYKSQGFQCEIVSATEPSWHLSFGFSDQVCQITLCHASVFKHSIKFFSNGVRKPQLCFQFQWSLINYLMNQFFSFQVLFHNDEDNKNFWKDYLLK